VFILPNTMKNIDEKVYIGANIALCVCGIGYITVENGVVNDVYHVLDLSANVLFVYYIT
jgi:hypothetical protein